MIPGLRAIRVSLLVLSIGSLLGAGWCLYDAYRPAEATLQCYRIPLADNGRYRLAEPCHETWFYEAGALPSRTATITLDTDRHRREAPPLIRLRTAHPPAAQIMRHGHREDGGTTARYARRHEADLWPVGVPLDLHQGARHITVLSDPPLPFRDATVALFFFGCTSLLALLWLVWLERRWTSKPSAF